MLPTLGKMTCKACGFHRRYVIGSDPKVLMNSETMISIMPGQVDLSPTSRIEAVPIFCDMCIDITYTNLNAEKLICLNCGSEKISNIKREGGQSIKNLSVRQKHSETWPFEPVSESGLDESSKFLCPKCKQYELTFFSDTIITT